MADKRIALVIGNSNYQQVPKLPNPSADANAIAQLLKNAGFERVDLQIDLGKLSIQTCHSAGAGSGKLLPDPITPDRIWERPPRGGPSFCRSGHSICRF